MMMALEKEMVGDSAPGSGDDVDLKKKKKLRPILVTIGKEKVESGDDPEKMGSIMVKKPSSSSSAIKSKLHQRTIEDPMVVGLDNQSGQDNAVIAHKKKKKNKKKHDGVAGVVDIKQDSGTVTSRSTKKELLPHRMPIEGIRKVEKTSDSINMKSSSTESVVKKKKAAIIVINQEGSTNLLTGSSSGTPKKKRPDTYPIKRIEKVMKTSAESVVAQKKKKRERSSSSSSSSSSLDDLFEPIPRGPKKILTTTPTESSSISVQQKHANHSDELKEDISKQAKKSLKSEQVQGKEEVVKQQQQRFPRSRLGLFYKGRRTALGMIVKGLRDY